MGEGERVGKGECKDMHAVPRQKKEYLIGSQEYQH